nr:hypothetical protein [Tanacetum cinerariifolium]
MDTEEVSDIYVASCLVHGLEVYAGEINLGMEENTISNEFAVKLCLDHEVKHGNKVVKKELIIVLRGEIYFVKFIINLEKDDVEPGVEERLVIKTMAYSDKYKKILDGICLDKMKLDGEIKKEEEEAITRIKGEVLIEKEDPRAFMILIWLDGKINLNALVDTDSDINVMPYRVYKELGREEVQNVKRGIIMLNH